MSTTTHFKVYSAMTEAQTLRHFATDAAAAEREGYVPVSESWDGTTLTVKYDKIHDGAPEADQPKPSTGFMSRFRRRLLGTTAG